MKRFTIAAAVVIATMLLSTSLVAQPQVKFLAAGSSAMFNTLAYAADKVNSDGYVLCGSNTTGNLWSAGKNGDNGPYILDSRDGAIPHEQGDLWVAWDGAADGSTAQKICAMISVDSAVGVRAALATPGATLFIPSGLKGTLGQKKVTGIDDSTVTLPNNIYAALNGATIGVAATDVRPEDAKWATVRALTTLGDAVSDPNPTNNGTVGSIFQYVKGLGYASSNANIGVTIQSSKSSTGATPVNFALYGKDPFGSNPAVSTSWSTIPVGAAPVIVAANTNTGSAFAAPGCNNVNIAGLCGVLDGSFTNSADICGGASGSTLVTFLREPLSGTYNTMEYSGPASYQCYSTQEKGVDPSNNNPLGGTYASGNTGRFRAIGTSEMVKAIRDSVNSIGYAFWGYGNFSSSNTGGHEQYLTIDNVDPLFDNPTSRGNGTGTSVPGSAYTFPVQNGDGTYPYISFPNVANGSYRIWTTYRLLTANSSYYDWAKLFATVAQNDQIYKVFSDFVPMSQMKVFHDHYYTANIGAQNILNGYSCANYYETGGDAGGLVYTCQQEADYEAANANAMITGKHQ